MHLGPWNVDLVRKGPWLRFVVTLLLGKKKAVARICLRTSRVSPRGGHWVFLRKTPFLVFLVKFAK